MALRGTEAAPTAVGVDSGATLVKIALRDAGGGLRYRLEPASDRAAVRRQLEVLGTRRLGLTGAGATALAEQLTLPSVHVDEFQAWRLGAAEMLRREDGAHADRYLLVSLGTGTSVLLSQGDEARRVGGTALGGGTVLGLARLLIGPRSFAELAELASRGGRHRVDLLVRDIGDVPLPGDLTAANFGKLARAGQESPAPEDLAHALMGLIGENVALICAGLADAHGVEQVVFGGGTLRGNDALRDILRDICSAFGLQARFLRDGAFAGALGALRLAETG